MFKQLGHSVLVNYGSVIPYHCENDNKNSNKNKHCEVLVSCSGRKIYNSMEAQRSACKLMELHAG